MSDRHQLGIGGLHRYWDFVYVLSMFMFEYGDGHSSSRDDV